MRTVISALLLMMVAGFSAFSGSITSIGLFDTGSVPSGSDPHYQIVGTGQAAVVAPVPAAWIANSVDSRWVSDMVDVSGMTSTVDQNYTYWTTFDLTNYVLSTVVISGWWAVDDYGAIHLNGSPTPLAGTTIAFDPGGSQYSTQHPFTINAASGLVQGVNILAIGVNNKGAGEGEWNPRGLRIEWTSFEGTMSAIPEPSSLFLLGGGLLGLGLLRRRQ